VRKNPFENVLPDQLLFDREQQDRAIDACCKRAGVA
jgi:hypothetical protein